MNNDNLKRQSSDKKKVLSLGIPSIITCALIWIVVYYSSLLNYNVIIKSNNGVPNIQRLNNEDGIIGTAERLAFALKCIFVAAMLFPVIIQKMASKRLNSEAINPLLLEERALNIPSSSNTVIDQQTKLDFIYLQTMQRILQNTIEQFIIFSMNVLVLSLYLHPKDFKIIILATLTFVLTRVAFWIGYLKHYVMRAVGFSVGMFMNVVLFVVGLYFVIGTDILPYFI